MQQQGRLSIHPYIGGTTWNMLRAACRNGGVGRAYIGKYLLTLVATMLLWPLRVMEQIRFSGAVNRTTLTEPPIFVIGHWRSGTTHLHNLLAQDPRLGFVSTLQAIFPTFCILVGRYRGLKRIVAGLIPEKRMMDNVKMDLDFPQEEEFSLSCLSVASHHCNHFPSTIRESFDRFVLFNVDDAHKQRWKANYMAVLKKATFIAGGKRLVLKNPYNTARIKVLLELFPDAQFVHIYRNPYNIYVSSLHDFIKEAEEMALQDFTEDEFAEVCFTLYEKLMSAYWETRNLVPSGNLVEVAYEDLEQDPLGEVRRIYDQLSLGEAEQGVARVATYLESVRGYKKNSYTYNESLVAAIRRRWSFALDRLGYSMPADVRISAERAWTCTMD